uniref:Tripartite motif containing 35-28 n=1 Tax=Periophthalmus magnuspinnatus TaxID=409849 RepID=A0A3B4B2B0_9GOBI
MDVDMENEASGALRRDLTCPVCQNIFSDPVLLPCTHSFCRECLQRSWLFNKKCPFCRELFTEDQAIANRDLKNACDTFVKQTNWTSPPKPSEFSCTLHLKPLELYCELDERLVCVDCATLHSTHRLLLRHSSQHAPLTHELNGKVEYFEKKIDLYGKMRQTLFKTVEYIKKQAGAAENQIKEEFERLHNFLQAEENMRLKTLATEVKEKISNVQEKIFETEEHLKSLKDHLDTLKNELDNEDLPLLMRVSKVEKDCLLVMSKHVGSLSFNIWKSMKDCVHYYPVVLDPNTASPWLALSPDMISMKESLEPLPVPDNPDRFDPCVFVLGAEGYTSGKHKWEVSVGDNPKWILGVCKESVVRKKMFRVSTTGGVWAIRLSKGMYTALTQERTQLPVNSCPEKICVRLNMDKGEVSFYDGLAEKHLVSFTFKLEKGEKMYPLFGPGLQNTPMTIVPGKVKIHTS